MILFCSVMDLPGPEKFKYNEVKIDEVLFRRIAANDIAAFEKLYLLTQRSIYAYALSILRNHDDSMDVLQETYLKIRGAAHLYKPMGKPMAWIFTITRNLAMSKLRQSKRTDDKQVEDMEDDLSFSYVTDSDDRLVLQAALEILNVEEREIILLHAISGFKHREIADNLGMPLATVLSKYNRGMGKLRKHLKGQEVQR